MHLAPASENLVARKLATFADLDAADRAALDKLWKGRRSFAPAQHDIVREGDPPKGLRLILNGWACRYKILPDGRRQILGFLLPGDLCDLHVTLLKSMDHSQLALTAVRYVAVGAAEFDALAAAHPGVLLAMRHDSLANAAIQREWAVSLGKRSAIERLGHLLCELFVRLDRVGLTEGPSCDLPVTQIELADALGLSPVHVNRTLRELRERKLVALQDRRLVLPDFAALRDLAMFDPAYLHHNRPANLADAG